MMRTRLLALLFIGCVLVIAGALQAGEKITDAIIVNDADEIWEDSTSISQDMLDNLSNVDTRVVAQYSDDLMIAVLTESPTALQTLLGAVPDRVLVQYADTNRREELVNAPGDLQGLLGQVRDRNIFQYADDNLSVSLDFPHGLIDDTFPPVVSNVSVTLIGDTSVSISWTTNEFADSRVDYGTQSGVYDWTVHDKLFVKQHEIILTGLDLEMTHYFRIKSTDLSGNTYTSPEMTFGGTIYLYVPFVKG